MRFEKRGQRGWSDTDFGRFFKRAINAARIAAGVWLTLAIRGGALVGKTI